MLKPVPVPPENVHSRYFLFVLSLKVCGFGNVERGSLRIPYFEEIVTNEKLFREKKIGKPRTQ